MKKTLTAENRSDQEVENLWRRMDQMQQIIDRRDPTVPTTGRRKIQSWTLFWFRILSKDENSKPKGMALQEFIVAQFSVLLRILVYLRDYMLACLCVS